LHVLVVDDSAMVRQVMQGILSTNSRVKVTVAADPLIAWVKMQKEPPDVVITDLEMPRMDGVTFIRKIMSEMPTPVVVCSGLAARGTELALRALEEGAVEVITKPKVGVRDFLHESAVTLVDAVWSASQAQVRPRPRMPAVPRLTADEVLPRKAKVRAAAVPNGLTVEYMPWLMPLFKEVPMQQNGELAMPTAPGLGLEFDQATIDRYRV